MLDAVLALTDHQLQMLLDASRPISVERRDAFLHDVASQLAARTDVGDGELHRLLHELQRRHIDYPDTGWGPHPAHARTRRQSA
jgi:hypothetical protein